MHHSAQSYENLNGGIAMGMRKSASPADQHPQTFSSLLEQDFDPFTLDSSSFPFNSDLDASYGNDGVAIVSPTPRALTFPPGVLGNGMGGGLGVGEATMDGPTPRAFAFPESVHAGIGMQPPSLGRQSAASFHHQQHQQLHPGFGFGFGSGTHTPSNSTSTSTTSTMSSVSPSPFEPALPLSSLSLSSNSSASHTPAPAPTSPVSAPVNPSNSINPFAPFDPTYGTAPLTLAHRRRGSSISSLSIVAPLPPPTSANNANDVAQQTAKPTSRARAGSLSVTQTTVRVKERRPPSVPPALASMQLTFGLTPPPAPTPAAANGAGPGPNDVGGASGVIGEQRPRRPKRGDEDYIKRPENAFILFRRECCLRKNIEEAKAASSSGPDDSSADGEAEGKDKATAPRRQRQADLSKLISQQWRSLSAEERKYWDDLAKQRKKEHEEMFPWYVYQPTRNANSSSSAKSGSRRGSVSGLDDEELDEALEEGSVGGGSEAKRARKEKGKARPPKEKARRDRESSRSSKSRPGGKKTTSVSRTRHRPRAPSACSLASSLSSSSFTTTSSEFDDSSSDLDSASGGNGSWRFPEDVSSNGGGGSVFGGGGSGSGAYAIHYGGIPTMEMDVEGMEGLELLDLDGGASEGAGASNNNNNNNNNANSVFSFPPPAPAPGQGPLAAISANLQQHQRSHGYGHAHTRSTHVPPVAGMAPFALYPSPPPPLTQASSDQSQGPPPNSMLSFVLPANRRASSAPGHHHTLRHQKKNSVGGGVGGIKIPTLLPLSSGEARKEEEEEEEEEDSAKLPEASSAANKRPSFHQRAHSHSLSLSIPPPSFLASNSSVSPYNPSDDESNSAPNSHDGSSAPSSASEGPPATPAHLLPQQQPSQASSMQAQQSYEQALAHASLRRESAINLRVAAGVVVSPTASTASVSGTSSTGSSSTMKAGAEGSEGGELSPLATVALDMSTQLNFSPQPQLQSHQPHAANPYDLPSWALHTMYPMHPSVEEEESSSSSSSAATEPEGLADFLSGPPSSSTNGSGAPSPAASAGSSGSHSSHPSSHSQQQNGNAMNDMGSGMGVMDGIDLDMGFPYGNSFGMMSMGDLPYEIDVPNSSMGMEVDRSADMHDRMTMDGMDEALMGMGLQFGLEYEDLLNPSQQF